MGHLPYMFREKQSITSGMYKRVNNRAERVLILSNEFGLFSSPKTSRPAEGSYSMVTLVLPRIKQPEREVYSSPISSAEVKNEWSYNSTPPIYAFMVRTGKTLHLPSTPPSIKAIVLLFKICVRFSVGNYWKLK